MSNAPKKAKVHYRESDGKPMAETPCHRDVTCDTIQGLEDWFVHDPMVYVSGISRRRVANSACSTRRKDVDCSRDSSG